MTRMCYFCKITVYAMYLNFIAILQTVHEVGLFLQGCKFFTLDLETLLNLTHLSFELDQFYSRLNALAP